MTFALIDAALEKGLPTLFIGRGFQELNAALGGTLHARLHEVEGRMDHRMRRVDDMDLRYGLRHPMSFTEGGRLAKIPGATEIQVTSLHRQRGARPAPGVAVEGHPHERTQEADSETGASRLALGGHRHTQSKTKARKT